MQYNNTVEMLTQIRSDIPVRLVFVIGIIEKLIVPQTAPIFITGLIRILYTYSTAALIQI